MIYPNKNIRFEESLLNKMTAILLLKRKKSIRIDDLYDQLKDEYETIDQFLISLDVLYALNAINLNEENGTIEYAN